MAIEMDKSKIMLGAGTALAAISIGLVMQAFDDGPILDAQTSPTPPPALEVEAITLTSAAMPGRLTVEPDALPDAETRVAAPLKAPQIGQSPDMSLMASNPDTPPVVEVAATVEPIETAPLQSDPEPACEIAMAASVEPAAMVELELTAPCLAGERFTLHHSGMMFTALTDEDGFSSLTVPALSENAVFIASFDNGDGAVVQADVEKLTDYGRVVVQWRGTTGLGLHAREFAADYFAEGHIHANARGTVQDIERGSSGALVRLGDGSGEEPLMAEIYTFPVSKAKSEGSIALSVEAEITAMNCDLDVEAQTLEVQAEGALRVQDLTLYMPGCDARGDFLVLKNLLEDMTLASR